MKKTFFVSTGFWSGLFLMCTLLFLPGYSFYAAIRAPFYQCMRESVQAYSQMHIPSILFRNAEARSNNDQLFSKTFKNELGQKFLLCIDTSTNPDLTLTEKIRSNSLGGVALYRDRLVVYSADKKQEQVILFKSLGEKFSYTLDDQKVAEISNTLSPWILFGIVLTALCFLGVEKIFWWLFFSILYSGKASRCGGGNCSLSLWILTPATLYQTFTLSISPGCCAMYCLILFFSAWFMGRFLVPFPEHHSVRGNSE